MSEYSLTPEQKQRLHELADQLEQITREATVILLHTTNLQTPGRFMQGMTQAVHALHEAERNYVYR